MIVDPKDEQALIRERGKSMGKGSTAGRRLLDTHGV